MNDRLIKDLLQDVADAVEPGDRLDAILAATSGRRTGRAWWAAGGVALVAASVVTALALTTGGSPRTQEPDAAEPSPTAPTTPPTTVTDPATTTVAVYYVGDTPDGPRLYREFRRVEGDALEAAVSAAVGRATDGSPLAPLDPDYRSPWPPATGASASVEQDVITIDLGGDPQDGLHDRGSMSEAEAGLAVEQLVRTAQGVVGERLPVRFMLFGEVTDQVLGVPTSEELATAPDLDVLAHVSLSDPSEGQVVDNDEPFVVTGRANSFEGNVVTRIQRWEGTQVVAEEPAIAGWEQNRLYPFEVTFDVSDVPPGDYVVMSRTDDPSGAGRFHTDSRRLTVVD